jgi:hypothetical protein
MHMTSPWQLVRSEAFVYAFLVESYVHYGECVRACVSVRLCVLV